MTGSMRPSRKTTSSKLSANYAENGGGDQPSGNGGQVSNAPSMANFMNSFYSGLPPVLREMLPFGSALSASELEGPPQDKRGETSWQDVCFVHSIPGDDNDEALVVLADGRALTRSCSMKPTESLWPGSLRLLPIPAIPTFK
jgi:hypothetical protein